MNIFALIFLQGNAGAFLIQLAPIFAIFGVFYFLVIMPQKRRQRELQAMVENLKAGDRIITNGGIVATVTPCVIRRCSSEAPINQCSKSRARRSQVSTVKWKRNKARQESRAGISISAKA